MRVEYGNGGKVNYTRDDFRRVTGIHYDDATEPRFTYDYGANGQAAYVKDAELGRTVWTEYDTSERPIRMHLMESVTSTSTGTPKYTSTLGYDEFGNVASFKEKVNNSASYETAYTYNIENQPTQLRFGADNRKLTYTYDPIGRLYRRVAVGAANYTTQYAYFDPDPEDTILTTPLVTSITQNGQNFSYTYDNVGNITSVTRNGLTTTYEYDSLGQLTRVNDPHAGKSTMYLYDCGGNMTGYLSAPYTLAPTLEGVNETVFYTYGDSNWKDKVTAIGGKAITYDAIGNPLTYDGWTFTWKAGRMLASMVKTGTNAQFTYDHNGLRIKKVVNGVTTNYTLSGKNVVHMTQGGYDLHFFYDAQGKPAMVRFNGTDYFYIYNLQNDAVAIVDTNGTQVVEYGYDAWGNPISKTGTLAATLGTLNPFRYRGYVYDEETGLYYLESRYYNPAWYRFVSIDCRIANIFNIINNAWAYCYNEPIYHIDSTGTAGKKLVPTQSDGYVSPNSDGSPQWSSAKNGWLDTYGNVWIPQTGARAHGGEHWDVQSKRGNGYHNVYPGGKVRPGQKPYPHLPNLNISVSEPVTNGTESMPYSEPLPTLGPVSTPSPRPTPAPLPPPSTVIPKPLPPMNTTPPMNPVIDIDFGDILSGGTAIALIWALIKYGGAYFTGGLTMVLP